ncbi:MAG TPA: thioredoxin [Verrucomicrobiae bacterium]|nr:thioredoxin [Verrucomicrobiae bacterium]
MALILSILVGAGLGGLMGYYGKCASGTCPLTATPGRGAIYGMVLGLLFYSALGRHGAGSAEQSTANVKLVNAAEFDSAIAQANGPVVVDFFATWCGPCKRLGPLLDELAGPLTNHIKFLKVDVDKSGPIAGRYRVEGVPTLVFLRDGKEVDRQVGLSSKEELQARLSALANSSS